MSQANTSTGAVDPKAATQATIADEVKFKRYYMCACGCGIKVSLRDGAIRYIEGNKDHPVNRGVLWAKGSAGKATMTTASRVGAICRDRSSTMAP